MSLAVAIFGQPRKATEQTHPLQLNVPMATVPGPKWLSLRPASFEDVRAEQYDQSPGLGPSTASGDDASLFSRLAIA